MEDFPLVTIVTLTYKKFEDVYKTIQSVLNQTYPRIQYIISDDGSANFPSHDIDSYILKNKKNNIISYEIISHTKNIGTVKNINYAYRKADGVYLLPLSVGDVFTAVDIVDRIIHVFLEKNVEIVCTSRIAVDERYKPLYFYPHILLRGKVNCLSTSEQQYRAFILERQFGFASGSATYLKKDTWLKMRGFDENFKLWEDGPFYVKYTSQGGIIEFAIDIISIKYKLGGVSNGSTDMLLLKDMQYFNEIYRSDITGYSFWDKRWIQFLLNKCDFLVSNKKNNICIAPDILLRRIYNKFWERVAYEFDRRNIKCR